MNNQRAYFDEAAHRYPTPVDPPLAQRLELEHLEQALGKIPGKHIVDFGAGSGRVTFWFLKKGYNVTAVDISPTLFPTWSKRIHSTANRPGASYPRQQDFPNPGLTPSSGRIFSITSVCMTIFQNSVGFLSQAAEWPSPNQTHGFSPGTHTYFFVVFPGQLNKGYFI